MASAAMSTTASAELATARQHYRAGELEQAERLCRKLLRAEPNQPDALHLLGRVLQQAGKPGLAAALFAKAITSDPTSAAYHHSLGVSLLALGKLSEAETRFRRALELDPSYASACLGLGVAQLSQGQAAAAEQSFQRALALQPNFPHAHSNILFALHYLASCDRATLFELAREWGRRYAEPLRDLRRPHANVPDPERRIRVGYVSGDFRRHPVAHVLALVLPAHDRTQVEVCCYTNRRFADDLTERLRAAADRWRCIADRDDAAVAELIRADGIDLLVDLAGHTEANRLTVFARKPAPVQATWLGYFDTTGVAAIDYLIADRVVCPEGDDRFYVERVVRLPDAFLCYRPPDAPPDVAPPPALSRGQVTFGCFNNAAKVTPEVISVWVEILRALPAARLCLKTAALDDPKVRDRYRSRFAGAGVAPERVTLLGQSRYADYLAAYGEIDIALDPFPYTGGATTSEALWMGVPVITLKGDRFVSRMGASILSAAGLGEWIAESGPEYVQKAIALAGDRHRLAVLRASLREQLARSPLGDGQRFTRGLEAAYREMWRAWCRSTEPRG